MLLFLGICRNLFLVLNFLITVYLQETQEIQDAFENYKDEMSDLTETVEIATLDKEMAEEKVTENLQNIALLGL